MAQRLQTVLDDELAEAVKAAAAAERRSVSEWIAFRLEEMFEYPEVEELARREARLSGGRSLPDAEQEPSFHPVGCPHDRLRKEAGASGGLVRVCQDCGERLLR